MFKRLLLICLCCGLLTLSGCAALPVFSQSQQALPDLRQLNPLPYEEPQTDSSTPAEEAQSALRVDLWLDASQLMGGINTTGGTLYPHYSRKYREGGFHYRYQDTVGWYETLLRCMLSSVEGSRVRLLRCGNERLTDDFLIQQGLASATDSADTLRSLRRDMLTAAIDPLPTVFSGFSAENMADSFYSLGSPMMNRLDQVNAGLMENPCQTEAMSAALDTQRAAVLAGEDSSFTAIGQENDYPLLYALENIDLNRLSIITCDPAEIVSLSPLQADGSSADLLFDLLTRRGVFQSGLCVGVYAFTLDYLGEISSFSSVSLSEPLIWGQMKYDSNLHQSVGVLPMPRTLLAFVIGQPEQVESFCTALNAQMEASPVLKEQRGPDKGQLAYTQNGQTVTQEPFSFAWEYACIQQPGVSCYTQYSGGATLEAGKGTISQNGSLSTALLTAGENDRLTLTLPLSALPQGVSADLTQLSGLTLSVDSALLLTDTLPNEKDTVLPQDAQILALRDTLYVFTRQEQPFAVGDSPFRWDGLSLSEDGTHLLLSIQADGQALQAGYYRLCLSADFSAESLIWQTPEWARRLSTSFTGEERVAWEDFSQLIHRYDGKSQNVPRQFQHAWGAATDRSYHGSAIPDIPSLMLCPGLEEVFRQLQQAASQGESPFLRYVFDVFADVP